MAPTWGSQTTWRFSWVHNDYPLVNVYITMEKSQFLMGKEKLFQWPFSIAMGTPDITGFMNHLLTGMNHEKVEFSEFLWD
jgi:hypothetical protein